MDKVMKWCYGGQDKDFFESHMDEINEHNVAMTDTFMNVIPLLVLIYFLDFFFMKKDLGITGSCALFFMVMVISRILFQTVLKGKIKNSYVYMLVNFELFYAFLLMVGPIFDSDNLACFIPAFAGLLFIFPIIPMNIIFLEVICNIAIFIVIDFIFKDYSLAMNDTFDVLACAAAGFVLGQSVLKGRLKVLKANDIIRAESALKIDAAERKALIDGLTGLGNRAASKMKKESIDARISKGEHPFFAILVCDVNGLKDLNDAEGHEAGDRKLMECVAFLQTIINKSEIYRFGGDEFVSVLEGADFVKHSDILNKLRTNTNFASGIAVYDPERDANFTDVFRRADECMYEHKIFSKDGSVRD